MRRPTSAGYHATRDPENRPARYLPQLVLRSLVQEKYISAATSPLERVCVCVCFFFLLRFFVFPPNIIYSENRRSDAADDASTARYLRANLATAESVFWLSCAHHPPTNRGATEDFHTVEADLLLVAAKIPFVHERVLHRKSDRSWSYVRGRVRCVSVPTPTTTVCASASSCLACFPSFNRCMRYVLSYPPL